MASLPTRPLALRRSFVVRHVAGAALPTLLLGALGVWALVLAGQDAARLATQDEVHARGVRAAHAEVDIERDLSLFVFRARRYEVRFRDGRGLEHHREVREHDVSLAPLVVEGPPDVRYLEDDPSRIAVGFARQNVGAQRLAIGLLASVGLVFLGLATFVLARASQSLRRARAASRAPQTDVAEVVSLDRSFDARGLATGELQLTLALTPRRIESRDTYRDRSNVLGQARGAGVTRLEAITPGDDPPVFLDTRASRVLVAMTSDGGAVLVRRSGHPFVLDDAEREALVEGAHAPPAFEPAPSAAS
ncbi:MAG: hypothetical protein U0353_15125 [Sandaracinus sp.]